MVAIRKNLEFGWGVVLQSCCADGATGAKADGKMVGVREDLF